MFPQWSNNPLPHFSGIDVFSVRFCLVNILGHDMALIDGFFLQDRDRVSTIERVRSIMKRGASTRTHWLVNQRCRYLRGEEEYTIPRVLRMASIFLLASSAHLLSSVDPSN